MIWELRHEFKIGLLIDVADIPRSTYYYYSKQFDHLSENYQRIEEKVCDQSQDRTETDA